MVAQHLISGKWLGSGETKLTIDPSTDQEVSRYYPGDSALLNRAIESARHTFENSTWRCDSRKRAHMLLECADALEASKTAIANCLTSENGKPISQSLHEVAAAINECRYYAGLARNIFGRTAEYEAGQQSLFTREAIGVAAIIVPWNAPATLLLRSLAPALAAGCTCVIKPAAETSGTHYLLMQAITSCDSLPDGVLNSVNDGGIELSEELVRHPEIDVISFTGSTSTGKRIMETASGTLKRLSLELGGKSPALVFDDANIDNAVSEITKSMLPHCGQMCTALGRAIVHENRLEEFVTKMQRSLSQIVIANAQNPDAQLGPLINAAAVERYLDNVAQGGEEGELLLRGDRATSPTLGSNNFVTPSLVLLQNTQSRLVQQELFAPYLIIETFSDAKDAIKSANATRYGLAASVYTESVRKAQSAARALKSGTVWINCHNRLMVEAETGGYRESGLGRLHGAEGLAPFLETKHIYSQFEAW